MDEKQDALLKQQDMQIKKEDLHLKRRTFWLQVATVLVGATMAYLAYCGIKHQIAASESKRQEIRDAEVASREKEIAQQKKEREAEIALKEKENELREREFKLKVYERQLELYLELTDVCARISLSNTPRQATRDRERLRELCSGKTLLLADPNVIESVISFNDQLSKLDKKIDEPIPDDLSLIAQEVAPQLPFILINWLL